MKQGMLRLQEENEILKKAVTIFARKLIILNYAILLINIRGNRGINNYLNVLRKSILKLSVDMV